MSSSNRGVGIHGLPPWMQAEKISWSERMEINAYKVISYIPVAVTVGLFSFLFLFYSYVSFLPSKFLIVKISYSVFCTLPSWAIFTTFSAWLTCGKIKNNWMLIGLWQNFT